MRWGGVVGGGRASGHSLGFPTRFHPWVGRFACVGPRPGRASFSPLLSLCPFWPAFPSLFSGFLSFSPPCVCLVLSRPAFPHVCPCLSFPPSPLIPSPPANRAGDRRYGPTPSFSRLFLGRVDSTWQVGGVCVLSPYTYIYINMRGFVGTLFSQRREGVREQGGATGHFFRVVVVPPSPPLFGGDGRGVG